MITARQRINVGVWLCLNKTLFAQLGGKLGVAYGPLLLTVLGHLELADTFGEMASLSFSRAFGWSQPLSGLRGWPQLSHVLVMTFENILLATETVYQEGLSGLSHRLTDNNKGYFHLPGQILPGSQTAQGRFIIT